jgi:hypothetical protein
MMVRFIPVLLALAACAPSPEDKLALIAKAKVEIAKELESPATAEFRNVRVTSDGTAQILGVVCGEVRGAKDQPVDAPFRRMIYTKIPRAPLVEVLASDGPETSDSPEVLEFQKTFDEIWNDSCR